MFFFFFSGGRRLLQEFGDHDDASSSLQSRRQKGNQRRHLIAPSRLLPGAAGAAAAAAAAAPLAATAAAEDDEDPKHEDYRYCYGVRPYIIVVVPVQWRFKVRAREISILLRTINSAYIIAMVPVQRWLRDRISASRTIFFFPGEIL